MEELLYSADEPRAANALSLASTRNRILDFKKADRLLSERDFAQVLSNAHRGGRQSGRISVVGLYKVYRDGEGQKPRIGIAVGKKLLRRSVDRNRVKRCVREFFRLNKSSLEGGFLIKLDKKPPAFDFTTLTQGLEKLTK